MCSDGVHDVGWTMEMEGHRLSSPNANIPRDAAERMRGRMYAHYYAYALGCYGGAEPVHSPEYATPWYHPLSNDVNVGSVLVLFIFR